MQQPGGDVKELLLEWFEDDGSDNPTRATCLELAQNSDLKFTINFDDLSGYDANAAERYIVSIYTSVVLYQKVISRDDIKKTFEEAIAHCAGAENVIDAFRWSPQSSTLNESDSSNVTGIDSVEQLKQIFIEIATGRTYKDEALVNRFKILRNKLINSELRDRLPDFVIKYRELEEFWPFIKEKGSYADRRAYIGDAFNSLLDDLERGSVPSLAYDDSKTSTLKQTIDKQIFIIMPFLPDFDDVYLEGIRKPLDELGYIAYRVDEKFESTRISIDIFDGIERSALVIADLSNNNPNVMFELGYSMGLRKKVILLTQSVSALPFDLKDYRAIVYRNTHSGIEQLKVDIKKYISTIFD